MKPDIKPTTAPKQYCIIRIPNEGQYTVHLIHSTSNCKLTTWEHVNGLYHREPEIRKQLFDAALKNSRIVTYLNTTDPVFKKWIHENYEIYESVNIPVGYNGGYQYHIFIRNKIGVRNENMRPTQYKGESTKDVTDVRDKLVTFLRKYKRKTDLVDDIIQMVK